MDEERLNALRSILGEHSPVSLVDSNALTLNADAPENPLANYPQSVEAENPSHADSDIMQRLRSMADPSAIAAAEQRLADTKSGPGMIAANIMQYFPRLRQFSGMIKGARSKNAKEATDELSQRYDAMKTLMGQENWEKEYDLKKAKETREQEKYSRENPSEMFDMDSAMTQFGRGLVKNQLDKAGMTKLSPLVDSMNMSQLGAVSEKFGLGNQFSQAMQNYRAELQAKGYESRQSEVNERQFNTLVDAGRRRLESNTKAFRDSIMTTEDLGEMSRLMREGNTLAASTYAAKYARGVAREVGVLTESDLTRYTNSKQLARKSADIINQWMNGRPTDATIEELNLITQALNEKTQQHIQSFANQEIERMSKSTKRPVEEISDYLGYSYDPSVKAFGKKEKSTSDISKMAIIDTPKGRKTVPRSELKKYLDAGAKLVE